VGGVYVHPDFRGMGIARRMATEFAASLIGQGRGVTLFVKKSNLAARRLYASLGFVRCEDYRISYY
jgi:predicted GNAT family acetyltransferase